MQSHERITVEMIEQKAFRQKARGYDPNEVDPFLDSICDEMVTLLDEIDTLTRTVNQLQAQPPVKAAPVQAPAEPPVPRPQAGPAVISDDDLETIRSILSNAKKVSDQTIRDAQDRARAIEASARDEAEKRLGSLEEEHTRLQGEIDTLKSAAKDYRDRFSQLIENQKHVLTAERELFL